MDNQKLLTREQFVTQVFARSKGICVFCTNAAVNAHHIFERKLFADGGYYLSNGAALCATHHWECEITRLPVSAVHLACKITYPKYPDGLDPTQIYDKWGNRVRKDGLRGPGPLFEDTGCRRALQAGGFLGRFVTADLPEPEISHELG